MASWRNTGIIDVTFQDKRNNGTICLAEIYYDYLFSYFNLFPICPPTPSSVSHSVSKVVQFHVIVHPGCFFFFLFSKNMLRNCSELLCLYYSVFIMSIKVLNSAIMKLGLTSYLPIGFYGHILSGRKKK